MRRERYDKVSKNKVKKQKKESYFTDVFGRFKAHKLAMFGLIVLILEVILVLVLPVIMNLDPTSSDKAGGFGAAPSAAHILGTDDLGRDLFARLIHGGRVSLFVGLVSTAVSMVIGVPLGLLAGYYRGWIETVIMRFADIFMSFPSMMLILVLVSVIGPSITSVTVVIGILGWTAFARLIYSNTLSIREKEYVESARAIGTKDLGIMIKYILPNAFAPCLITLTFRTAQAILMESSLSFLGMGVQPPQASWGNLMYDAQSIVVLSSKPWVWVPPGVLLIITVLSINFFGDGLRDALDPKMKI